MRITSLTLTDLRRYRGRDFELDPGLTIVRGPNEAGKTTLQRAIELDPRSREWALRDDDLTSIHDRISAA